MKESLLTPADKVLEQKNSIELENEIDERIKLQNQFEAFLKYSPGAIAMFDNGMRYIMANDGWYRDYNLNEVDIIGKSHYEIFPQIKEIPRWLDDHKRALSGETLKCDLDAFEQNGEVVYLKWQLLPWRQADDSIGGIIMSTEIITEEVKTQLALDKQQKDFSMLIDEMSGGFLHGKMEYNEKGEPVDWKYLNINKAFEHETGLKRQKVLGEMVTKLLPNISTDKANWIGIYGEVAKTGKEDTIIGYSEDLDRYFEASIYSPRKGEFASIFRNVTDREVAIEKLKISEARFRNIFDKSIFGMALVGEDGKPFLVNMLFCKWLEYTDEELCKMSFDLFTHPDDVSKDWDNYESLLKGDIDSYTIDKRYITKSGSLRYVKLNVTLVDDFVENRKYALAIVEDHTENELNKIEQKKAVQRADHLDELVSTVSGIAKIGSWEVDIETNQAMWSDVVYEIHEVEKGTKILVEDGINFYHPDHQVIISKAVKNAITRNEPWDMELKIITATKKEKWVRAIGQAVSEKGKVQKLQGLFQDIDEKKRNELKVEETSKNLEKLVEERTSELRKANQELESFSYSVSHDLRAPLRAINGFAEALCEDHKNQLNDNAVNFLDRIVANSVKMGQLIDDLLEFSRMNRKKTNFKRVDLTKLISKIVKDAFTGSDKDIHIGNLPSIDGDLEMLEQVFTNLLSNAVKYSSKEAKPHIKILATESDKKHTITVTDNGVGFDMAYADKLFRVFERLHSDAEFEGTGVGLALCQKIITAHNGEIWAESKQGIGTSFHVKFQKTS